MSEAKECNMMNVFRRMYKPACEGGEGKAQQG